MLPALASMIGFYIIARSVEMISHSRTGDSPNVVNVLAAISIAMAVIGMATIFVLGVQVDNLANEFREAVGTGLRTPR